MEKVESIVKLSIIRKGIVATMGLDRSGLIVNIDGKISPLDGVGPVNVITLLALGILDGNTNILENGSFIGGTAFSSTGGTKYSISGNHAGNYNVFGTSMTLEQPITYYSEFFAILPIQMPGTKPPKEVKTYFLDGMNSSKAYTLSVEKFLMHVKMFVDKKTKTISQVDGFIGTYCIRLLAPGEFEANDNTLPLSAGGISFDCVDNVSRIFKMNMYRDAEVNYADIQYNGEDVVTILLGDDFCLKKIKACKQKKCD